MASDAAREIARRALYTLSPSAWCRRELKLALDPWQVRMVDAPAASRVIALTFRQAGKTSAAAVSVAHTMTWRQPGSTSLVLAPTLRQSSELIRNLRGRLLAAGERLTVDNVFAIELATGRGRWRCRAPTMHRSAASPSMATAWSMRRPASATLSTKPQDRCSSVTSRPPA